MEVILAFVIGSLYAMGVFMVLRRNIIKLVIGFILLSHASNLLIFTVSRLVRGKAPIIAEGAVRIEEVVADPVPQALILTAIVISFGITAFAIVLIKRTYQTVGSEDLNKMTTTDTIKYTEE